MRPKFLLIFACVIFFGLAVEVVFLVMQNRKLHRQFNQIVQNYIPRHLQVGERVQAIDVIAPTGERKTLDYGKSDPDRLFFIISTQCSKCTDNLPLWHQLYSSLIKKDEIEIFGLTTDSSLAILNYTRLHAIAFPIYQIQLSDLQNIFKVGSVPQTIYVDCAGVVNGIWIGAFKEEYMEHIEKQVTTT